jgi:hypothetical protein
VQPADPLSDRHRHRDAARALAAGVVLIGIVLLVAGCGGSGTPGVASVKSTTSSSTSSSSGNSGSPASGAGGSGPSTSSGGGPSGGSRSSFALAGGNRQTALKFTACMRANGLPNFPDPNAEGVIQGSSSEGIDPGSPQFQAAQKKCEKYAPRGGAPSPAQQAKADAQALKFSACMRSHGVTSFPDPQISGGRISIQIKGGPGSGLDPNSPLFQRAQKACGSALPGANGGPGPATSGG